MSYQIVKQPNGNFAVFSTGVDCFVLYDADRSEVLAWAHSLETRDLGRRMDQWAETVEKVASGSPRPYFQFTRTWDECVETAREHQDPEDFSEIMAAASA
jgi:hypothetical protein